MALFDVPDEQMADSGTAEELLRKKWPGFMDAQPAAPANGNAIPQVAPEQRPTLFAPNTPDTPGPSPSGAANDPYTPQDLVRRQAPAPTPPPRSPNSYLPWTQEYRDYQQGRTKAQKLGDILKSGIMGAIAGRASSEQAVIQSGGRRSGGFGMGFQAAQEAPIQQAQQRQAVQRGQLENQQLQQQVTAFPQTQALGIREKMSVIGKNESDAILNAAKTDAERYKPVGDVIYDMKAPGGPKPIQGSTAGQFIPASPELAQLAGIAPGAMIRTETATKLETLSNNAPPQNVEELNSGLQQRYQILNPGKQLPPYFRLQRGATKTDFDRVDKLMQQTEQAQGTKALRDQSSAIRGQTLSMAQQNQADREEKQGLAWVSWEDKDGRTVAGPLSMARKAGAQNPATVPTEEVRNITDARNAVRLINKQGDSKAPETMGVLQLAQSLDKDGKMGVFTSRLNKLLTKGVGAQPGDDARVVTLLDKSQLLMTLAMKAHFGASGGRSPQMLEHFISMADAGKMDAQTFIGGAKAVGDYMGDRAMIPGGGGTPQYSRPRANVVVEQ